MNTAPDGTPSLLSPDDYAYIRSTEFKERFGDWEKAWRLEKAKRAPNIFTSDQIILNEQNITDGIETLRKNRNTKMLRFYAKQIGKNVSGTYFNEDTKTNICVFSSSISEIRNHHITADGVIESIIAIPDIIKNSVFITEERNTDSKKKFITKYQYFLSGMTVQEKKFTVKSVIGIDQANNKYYDHKVFDTEKSILIDLIGKRGFCSTQYGVKPYALQNPLLYDDKRLYEICQCPQAKFLDKNFEPKKEIIDAVRKGKTLDDLLHTPQRKELSRSVLDQFLKDKGLDTPSRSVTPPQKNITNPKNNGFEL